MKQPYKYVGLGFTVNGISINTLTSSFVKVFIENNLLSYREEREFLKLVQLLHCKNAKLDRNCFKNLKFDYL